MTLSLINGHTLSYRYVKTVLIPSNAFVARSIATGNTSSFINFNTGAIIGTNLSPNLNSAAIPPNSNARPSLGPGLGISRPFKKPKTPPPESLP